MNFTSSSLRDVWGEDAAARPPAAHRRSRAQGPEPVEQQQQPSMTVLNSGVRRSGLPCGSGWLLTALLLFAVWAAYQIGRLRQGQRDLVRQQGWAAHQQQWVAWQHQQQLQQQQQMHSLAQLLLALRPSAT